MSDYEIRIDHNVLNHLGMGLYSNTPAVLTEIISNAWDADANNVSIKLDNDGKQVVITDDGHGMSDDDVREKFLKVGYARRNNNREKSDGLKRQVMGRKGIGKLAMFSLANKISLFSKKDGCDSVALEIDVQALRDAINNGKTYSAKEIEWDGQSESGTKIVLSGLTKSIDRTESYLRKRIARRFSVIGEAHDFLVKINETYITVQDRDYFPALEFLWELGESDPDRLNACKNKTKEKVLSGIVEYDGAQCQISGYIGSVKLPKDLKVDQEINNNTITVIANGRVFQEDILQDFGSAKIYKSYLVGEIVADFLDDNAAQDMATSSRQQLQQNDPRYAVLKSYLDKILNEIDKDWDDWRREKGADEAASESAALKEWFESMKAQERKAAKKLIGNVNTLRFSGSEESQAEAKRTVIKNTVLAFEKLRIQDNLDKLDDISDVSSVNFKNIFASIDDVEASMFYEITHQRIKVIDKFEKITNANELERVVQDYLYKHLWLLDPSWERVTGETYIEQTLTKELKEVEKEATKGARIDIAYKTISGRHLIIEMKRPEVTTKFEDLIQQGRKYRRATLQWYKKNPNSPGNRGMGGGVPLIEVIFLLGKDVDYEEDPEYVSDQLRSIKARVMTYNDLITQSMQAYQEYSDKRDEVAKLKKIISKI